MADLLIVKIAKHSIPFFTLREICLIQNQYCVLFITIENIFSYIVIICTDDVWIIFTVLCENGLTSILHNLVCMSQCSARYSAGDII